MQSRSRIKQKKANNKQITCHFACPWADADVSSEKSTKEIHASEKKKKAMHLIAQTRKRVVPPFAAAHPRASNKKMLQVTSWCTDRFSRPSRAKCNSS